MQCWRLEKAVGSCNKKKIFENTSKKLSSVTFTICKIIFIPSKYYFSCLKEEEYFWGKVTNVKGKMRLTRKISSPLSITLKSLHHETA